MTQSAANERRLPLLGQPLSYADADTLVGVGMLDLDDFKAINDRYGHDLGDRLLQEFVTRVQPILRSGELLARIAATNLLWSSNHSVSGTMANNSGILPGGCRALWPPLSSLTRSSLWS